MSEPCIGEASTGGVLVAGVVDVHEVTATSPAIAAASISECVIPLWPAQYIRPEYAHTGAAVRPLTMATPFAWQQYTVQNRRFCVAQAGPPSLHWEVEAKQMDMIQRL